MSRPESLQLNYNAKYLVGQPPVEVPIRIFSSSPLNALAELHSLVQNTHRIAPEDYRVTFLQREGMLPYEFPVTRNPDVRHVKHGKSKEVTGEMFPVDSVTSFRAHDPQEGFEKLPPVMGLFGHERKDTPSAPPTGDAP